MAEGEIIISSPAKSAFCYYNNPEMTEQKFYKGFLYTGDVGTWDENEFVTVRGRKDDMIVSAGENIYPPQIEAVLNDHPKVAESAVIGAPDKLRGEVVAAYVVPSDPSLTVEELKEYCTNSPMLSSYKWPRIYNIVDSCRTPRPAKSCTAPCATRLDSRFLLLNAHSEGKSFIRNDKPDKVTG